MLNFTDNVQVHLAWGATDMRMSIDGLSGLVQQRFKLDPYSRNLYVFCNRGCNRLKVLQWDGNGFWLYYKRLERERFKWPQDEAGIKQISLREYRWLLDGLSLSQPQAHREIKVKYAV